MSRLVAESRFLTTIYLRHDGTRILKILITELQGQKIYRLFEMPLAKETRGELLKKISDFLDGYPYAFLIVDSAERGFESSVVGEFGI